MHSIAKQRGSVRVTRLRRCYRRRVAKDTRKRVVGLLLGEHNKGVTEVLNSFALPFEEDEKDTSILVRELQHIASILSVAL